MSGKLFIVATPIGNLSDISTRTKEALDEADIVMAEDTRVSVKLLNHLHIKKRLISCHDHNEAQRAVLLKEMAKDNKTIALLSDAGTPLISDPGYKIVQEAIAVGMEVIPLAGPSAFLLALVGSGLPCERFQFIGFLPDKLSALKKELQNLCAYPHTLVFYVSPHKLAKTIAIMQETFGDRDACLARELTKIHEEFLRLTLSHLAKEVEKRDVLGECVLIVKGLEESNSTAPSQTQILKDIKKGLAQGERVKELSARLGEQYGLPKSDIYKLALSCLPDGD